MPRKSQGNRIRWIAPFAAAAAVALIAVGAVALTNGGDEQQPSSQPDVRTVPLDRGPLSDAELMEMQLIDLPPVNGPYYTFHLTRSVDGLLGPVPVALASAPGGAGWSSVSGTRSATPRRRRRRPPMSRSGPSNGQPPIPTPATTCRLPGSTGSPTASAASRSGW